MHKAYTYCTKQQEKFVQYNRKCAKITHNVDIIVITMVILIYEIGCKHTTV